MTSLHAVLHSLLGLSFVVEEKPIGPSSHLPGIVLPPSSPESAIALELAALGRTYLSIRARIAQARSMPTHEAMTEAVLGCVEKCVDEFASKVCDIEQEVLRDPTVSVARVKLRLCEELRALPELLGFLQSNLHPVSSLMRRLESNLGILSD